MYGFFSSASAIKAAIRMTGVLCPPQSRVTRQVFGDEPRRASPLFVDGHHGALAVDPRHGRVDDRAALVDDPVEPQAVLPEILQRQGRTVAADLLVVGGEQIHVDGEDEARLQQLLDGGELREQRRLGVHRAAAPEFAVLAIAAEGRLLPLPCGVHHIVVGHHHDIPGGVRTCQLVQVGVVAQYGQLRPCRHQGEQLRDDLPQLQELRRLEAVLFGYRPTADHLRQTRCVAEVSRLQRGVQVVCHCAWPPFSLPAITASTSLSR